MRLGSALWLLRPYDGLILFWKGLVDGMKSGSLLIRALLFSGLWPSLGLKIIIYFINCYKKTETDKLNTNKQNKTLKCE